jgi:poly [ADP-ribose] polymerase 1
MAEMIEVAKTGRSKCRTCRQAIEKGALRFGEEQPSAFTDGLQWVWQHLNCAAKKKPAKVREALAAYEGEVPGRDELEAVLVEADKTATTFPYAEHAPTGRSRCQQCEEPIEKGALRVAFEREVEPGAMARAAAAYLHPACALEHLEKEEDLLSALKKNSRGLAEADLTQLEAAIGG